MPLSREQLRYIRRHGPRKSSDAIAKELKISVKRVRRALGEVHGSKGNPQRLRPREFTPAEWIPWIIAATCLVTPLLFWAGVRDFENLPKLLFIQGSALVLAFLALISRQPGRPSLNPPMGTLIVFASLGGLTVWSFLSLFWAPDTFSAVSMWIHGAACALIFFLVYGHISKLRHFERLLDSIVCAALLISLLGIAQYLGEVEWVKQQIPPAATFNNRNMAAHFLVLALPAAIAVVLSGKNPARIWTASLTVAFLLSFLFYTLTRAAWLGSLAILALATAFLAWHVIIVRRRLPRWSRHISRLAAGATGIIVLWVLVHLGPTGWHWPEQPTARMIRGLLSDSSIVPSSEKQKSRDILLTPRKTFAGPFAFAQAGARSSPTLFAFAAQSPLLPLNPQKTNEKKEVSPEEGKAGSSVSKIGSAKSVRIRFRLWKNSLEIIKDRPLLGSGLANFHIYYPPATISGQRDPELKLNRSPRQAHNDYIQLLTELGLPAAVFIIPALLVLLGSGFRLVFGGNRTLNERIVALASLAGIAGVMVDALFSFPFYRALPPLYFAVYSGVLMAMADGRFATQRGKAVGDRAAGGNILGPLLAEPRIRTGLWVAWGLAAAIWLVVQGRHVASDHFFKREMVALTQEKNFKEVVKWGSKAVSWNPWRTEAKHFLGRAFMRTGNLEKAEQLLSDVHRALPHSTSLLFDLGECYRELKEYEQAREHLLHALKFLPRNGELNGALGRVHLAQGNMEDAFRYFEKAIEDMPENGFYLFQLGHAAQAIGRSQRAQEALRQSLKFSGAWIPFTHKELGMLLIGSDSAKRQREGLKHLKRAMAMKPEIVDAERLKEFAAQIAAVDAGN